MSRIPRPAFSTAVAVQCDIRGIAQTKAYPPGLRTRRHSSKTAVRKGWDVTGVAVALAWTERSASSLSALRQSAWIRRSCGEDAVLTRPLHRQGAARRWARTGRRPGRGAGPWPRPVGARASDARLAG